MTTTAAIITLHNSPNYGSCLQTYATQRIFESLGVASTVVDYYRHDAIPENETERALNGQLAKKIPILELPGVKSLARVPVSRMVARRRAPLDEFRRSALNLTSQKYYSAEELEANPPDADVYVTGSDQVWNSTWNGGFERAFYLSYAPEGAKKIAYAASIGKSSLDDWEVPLMREALLRYDAISVREAEAAELLDSIGVPGAVPVVDPTLMLGRAEWEAISDGWCPIFPICSCTSSTATPSSTHMCRMSLLRRVSGFCVPPTAFMSAAVARRPSCARVSDAFSRSFSTLRS